MSQHQKHRYQHQGRADQARRSASPLPVTEPAEGIDEQSHAGKQRQQRGDEQAFPLAQKAQTDRSPQTGKGGET
ncbi:hypothetical protein D9M69_681240 [compost metagenome]